MTSNAVVLERMGRVAGPELDGFPGTHTQTPTPVVLDDRVRVFVSTRLDGRAHGAWIDLEPEPPFRVLGHAHEVNLSPGRLGCYDDEGIMPAWAVRDPDDDARLLLLVSGWNTRNTIRYHNATGLLRSEDDGLTWTRPFDGPVMDRTPHEPYLAVTPWAVRDGDGWFCLYISGDHWRVVDGTTEPVYVIRSARTRDLVTWERDARQVVVSRDPLECFSRPTLRRDGDRLEALFCARSVADYRDGAGGYALGAATSTDGGDSFVRREVEVRGDPPGDWERTMTAYPAWFEVDAGRFVLYNGDGFGRTGFGVMRHVG